MSKRRARAIDQEITTVVIQILDDWSGKLTWNGLIAAIKASTSIEYTRQALANHKQIADAFVLRKASLSRSAGRPTSSNNRVNTLTDAVDRLTVENEKLRAELNEYRDMFIRWTANAQKRGLTSEVLNEPLVKPQRGQTKE